MSPDSQRKKREQFALGNHIARVGIEMSPCSFCEKNGKKCVVLPTGTPRCSECVRLGKKCDVEGIPAGDWEAVEREEFRLDTAEMLAEDSFRKAQSALNEAVNRLARLRQQKKFLRKRAGDMLRRGLKTMDELDAVEEKEAREKEEAERQVLTPAGSADVSGDPLDDPLDFAGVAFDPDSALSPFFWDSIDVGGGISSKGPGN